MYFDHFYSDPHFGHAKIIEYCERPFMDVNHMADRLIENYNSQVERNETVLWLGDCFFRHTDGKMANVLDALNGKKVLVAGNHDRKSCRMAAVGFEFVTKQLVWQQEGHTFRGSHYPWRDMMQDERFPNWHPKRNKAEVLVHGHTHDKRKHAGGNSVHCGVDAWDYSPVSIDDVLLILRKNDQ